MKGCVRGLLSRTAVLNVCSDDPERNYHKQNAECVHPQVHLQKREDKHRNTHDSAIFQAKRNRS